MNLETQLTRKVGPLPMWVWLTAAVAVGWWYYKRRTAEQSDGQNGGDGSGDVSNGVSSPDSGTFTGTNSLTVDGASASQTSSGALLTGGWVGNPGGYGNAPPGGDVYVNVPTPVHTTNVITTGHRNPRVPPPPWSGGPRSGSYGGNGGNDHDGGRGDGGGSHGGGRQSR